MTPGGFLLWFGINFANAAWEIDLIHLQFQTAQVSLQTWPKAQLPGRVFLIIYGPEHTPGFSNWVGSV